MCILFYRRRDSPTPFTLDCDAFGRLIDVSKTGVCGESIGLLPTNELSNQNFLQFKQMKRKPFKVSCNVDTSLNRISYRDEGLVDLLRELLDVARLF